MLVNWAKTGRLTVRCRNCGRFEGSVTKSSTGVKVKTESLKTPRCHGRQGGVISFRLQTASLLLDASAQASSKTREIASHVCVVSPQTAA